MEHKLGRFLIYFGVVAFSSAAFAQQSKIEEIVVTATKRSTNLQETAMAITTMTQSELDSANVRGAEDLAAIVPTLNIGTSSGNLLISLRGVGSDNFFVAAGSAVAFHLDGVFRGRQTGGNAVFMDLERVEVLKGPQGTLYGRNATAGSINLISAKPTTDSFSGYIDATVGSFDRFAVRGAVNVPIVEDKFAIRAAYLRDRADGFLDNGPLVSKNYNDRHDTAYRLHGLFTPNDDLSVLLTYDYAARGGVGEVTQILPDADDVLEDIVNPYFIALNDDGQRDDDATTFRAEVNWDIGWAALDYIGAYFETDTHIIMDFDRGPVLDNIYDYRLASDQQSHELRLSSNTEGKLDWLVGAYFFDENVMREMFLDISLSFGLLEIHAQQPDFNVTSNALFGQVSYDLSDKVRLTGGLRYSVDDKEELNTRTVRTTPFGVTIGTGNGIGDWKSTDWKVGIDWFVADGSMLYANISTGYKSGGFNDPLVPLADPEFLPESILAYHVGQKSTFSEGRLQINSELYYYDYEDLQVNQIEDSLSVTRNAADSRIYGVDLDAKSLIGDNTSLDFSMSYLRAEFLEFQTFEILTGEDVNLAGSQMPRSPEWSFRVALQHDFVMGSGFTVTPKIAVTYASETKLRAIDDPGSIQPAYTRTDASILFQPQDRRWQSEVFVSNLEDEAVFNFGLIVGGNRRALSARAPRQVGLRFKYYFGG